MTSIIISNKRKKYIWFNPLGLRSLDAGKYRGADIISGKIDT
jgi:hypothetical protein